MYVTVLKASAHRDFGNPESVSIMHTELVSTLIVCLAMPLEAG